MWRISFITGEQRKNGAEKQEKERKEKKKLLTTNCNHCFCDEFPTFFS